MYQVRRPPETKQVWCEQIPTSTQEGCEPRSEDAIHGGWCLATETPITVALGERRGLDRCKSTQRRA